VSGCRLPKLPGRLTRAAYQGSGKACRKISLSVCRARVPGDDYFILRGLRLFYFSFAVLATKAPYLHCASTVLSPCRHCSGTGLAPDKHRTSPRPASGWHQASPGLALLIPDSLIPDSLIASLKRSSLRLPFSFCLLKIPAWKTLSIRGNEEQTKNGRMIHGRCKGTKKIFDTGRSCV